ncbi:YfgM family protein [Moraxella cuniculi]|uniref:Ancillary SecYEG translocon subunit n=1 Tax=Moraxella cuniculi TaxID=34061 RepID=A0A3S4SD10_9GAMM|nr:tetratricopeptide repeat protein [Moraxella cuniculi]VEG13421.1 Uncharacterised protein [Moraxella cuniculi]
MTQKNNENSADTAFADKQSISAIKAHGEKIVYAVIAVLLIFFGWQYYQKNYAKVDTVAADMYTNIATTDEQLLQVAQEGDKTAKAELAGKQEALFADIDKLVLEHDKTAYAWQALMIKARRQVAVNDLPAAVTTLNQAVSVAQLVGDDGLLAMSKIRYGRAMLANNDVEGALSIANESLPEAFEASRQELLGDVYMAKNDSESAKKAYSTAWELMRERQENRAVLALKLQSLGVRAEPIKVLSAAPTAQNQTNQQ